VLLVAAGLPTGVFGAAAFAGAALLAGALLAGRIAAVFAVRPLAAFLAGALLAAVFAAVRVVTAAFFAGARFGVFAVVLAGAAFLAAVAFFAPVAFAVVPRAGACLAAGFGDVFLAVVAVAFAAGRFAAGLAAAAVFLPAAGLAAADPAPRPVGAERAATRPDGWGASGFVVVLRDGAAAERTTPDALATPDRARRSRPPVPRSVSAMVLAPSRMPVMPRRTNGPATRINR
jgi:hypothetical protein